jgi:hypothetical protein
MAKMPVLVLSAPLAVAVATLTPLTYNVKTVPLRVMTR